MALRSKVDMAKFKREKIYRALVRLKHSLAADEELNEGLDKVRTNHSAKILKGLLPKDVDPNQLIEQNGS